MGLIYKRVSPSGGIYIGQTVLSESKRWAYHCCVARTQQRQTRLDEAIRKYGENAFTVEILEDNIPTELLDEREQYWIAFYDSYFFDNPQHYNMTRGGNQGRGYKHTDHWKAIHSERMKGAQNASYGVSRIWINDGEINHTVLENNLQDYLDMGYYKGRIESESAKQSAINRRGHPSHQGMWMTNGIEDVRVKTEEEILYYLSEGYELNKRNYKPTEESIRKSIRIGPENKLYGKKRPPEIFQKANARKKELGQIRPIIQIDKTTNSVISEYESITDAAKYLCLFAEHLKVPTVVGGIYAACVGIQKSAYGYIWKYKE